MRTSHVCPKCNHNHILLIEAVADKGDLDLPSPAHIAIAYVGEGWLGDKTKAAGQLSAAICRQYGYTELYTKDAPLIPVDGKYVREVIGPKAAPTPYR